MIEMKLYEYMRELLKQTPTTFVRYKYNEISWDSRLVGILGPRGIGKSTMILQRIKNTPETIASTSQPTTSTLPTISSSTLPTGL